MEGHGFSVSYRFERRILFILVDPGPGPSMSSFNRQVCVLEKIKHLAFVWQQVYCRATDTPRSHVGQASRLWVGISKWMLSFVRMPRYISFLVLEWILILPSGPSLFKLADQSRFASFFQHAKVHQSLYQTGTSERHPDHCAPDNWFQLSRSKQVCFFRQQAKRCPFSYWTGNSGVTRSKML